MTNNHFWAYTWKQKLFSMSQVSSLNIWHMTAWLHNSKTVWQQTSMTFRHFWFPAVVKGVNKYFIECLNFIRYMRILDVLPYTFITKLPLYILSRHGEKIVHQNGCIRLIHPFCRANYYIIFQTFFLNAFLFAKFSVWNFPAKAFLFQAFIFAKFYKSFYVNFIKAFLFQAFIFKIKLNFPTKFKILRKLFF